MENNIPRTGGVEPNTNVNSPWFEEYSPHGRG